LPSRVSTYRIVQNSQVTLNENVFAHGVRLLTNRDTDLAEVVQRYGPPPLWVREPGFPTLVYIILEQQVSLASAKAAFDRLNSSVHPLTPTRFLKLSDSELLRIGFSRQKTLYTRLLAKSLARRHFDLRYLHELHDDAARKMLIAFKGIGKWTADIYLLSALRRPDIWPAGDLALATAVQEEAPPPAPFARASRENVRAVASLARRRREALLASLLEQARPAHFGDFALTGQPSALIGESECQ
jgi:DNA-3-methyladenine glycosylase II